MVSNKRADGSFLNQYDILAGEPITEINQDRLGRRGYAEEIAKVLSQQRDKSLVFGIEGSWGTGKSSFLNLVSRYLYKIDDEVVVVSFNPWILPSLEDVIKSFFSELAHTLGKKDTTGNIKAAGDKAAAFAKFLSPIRYIPGAEPIAGVLLDALGDMGKALQTTADQLNKDLSKVRAELIEALSELKKPIVVFVDDVDRLANQEIRTIFQLVKAIANMPNLIFVLAYDPAVVAKALESTGHVIDGQSFIEKVVQTPIYMPEPSSEEVHNMFFDGLDDLMTDSGFPMSKGETERIAMFMRAGLGQFIKTPRNVVRLLNRMKLILPSIGGEVNVGDLIAIEALSIKHPVFLKVLRENPGLFLGPMEYEVAFFDETSDKDAKRKAIIEKLDKDENSVEIKIIDILFRYISADTIKRSYAGIRHAATRDRLISSPSALGTYLKIDLPPSTVSKGTMDAFYEGRVDRDAIIQEVLKNGQYGSFLENLTAQISEVKVENSDSMLKSLTLLGEETGEVIVGSAVKLFEYHMINLMGVAVEIVNKHKKEERLDVLKIFIEEADKISLVAYVASSYLTEHGLTREGESGAVPPDERSLTLEEAKLLGEIYKKKVLFSIKNNTLKDMVAFGIILYDLKEEWDMLNDAKRYVEKLLENNDGIDKLALTFSGRGSMEWASVFSSKTTLCNKGKERIQSVDYETLPESTKNALINFVKTCE